MPGIVCAIRGGPNSQPTIDKAVELSIEKNLEVFFLFIVNLGFLASSYKSHSTTIEEEMYQLGEFILLDVCSKAKEKGIIANSEIRKGLVSEEIIKLCKEISADYVILGKPKSDNDKNVISFDALDAFAQLIENETDAKVVYSERSNDEEI
jgi:nucleotide-binding universal stress UspA family protein